MNYSMTTIDILHIVLGIVASLGGGAAIVFMLSSWLGKVWAYRLMAAEQSKHNQALERLRADIRKEAFESEFRFTKLHEKRAEVIADLFAKLVVLVDAADQHLIGPRIDDKKAQIYRVAEQNFRTEFDRNQIYFAVELCDSLSSFISELRKSDLEKWIFSDCQPAPEADKAEKDEWCSRLKARYALVTEKVPLLKKQLTDEFRNLLGVHLHDNART